MHVRDQSYKTTVPEQMDETRSNRLLVIPVNKMYGVESGLHNMLRRTQRGKGDRDKAGLDLGWRGGVVRTVSIVVHWPVVIRGPIVRVVLVTTLVSFLLSTRLDLDIL